jgi:site-specific recombinase XerD
MSARTIEYYEWAIRRLGNDELPVSRAALMEAIADPALGQESRHDLWRALRRFYKWTHEEGHLEANPMLRVPAPRRRKTLPRAMDLAEIERLLSQDLARRDRAMLMLMLDTGIRLGEVAGIRWHDVYGEYLVVRGKTGARRVPMSPEVRQLLIGLGDAEHMWVGPKGPLTPTGVQQLLKRALRGAGIRPPKAGPHLLRHTFATHYVRAGGNVRVLQEIMGHQDLGTTMIYVHLAGRDVSADHALYSPARLRLLRGSAEGQTKEATE